MFDNFFLLLLWCWLKLQKPAFLVMHVGAPAPGMNAAVRACVRLALDKGSNIIIFSVYVEISLFNLNISTQTKGYRMMAAYNGFKSLLENIDEIEELNWLSVNGYMFKMKKSLPIPPPPWIAVTEWVLEIRY
jgi:hypothetical protein